MTTGWLLLVVVLVIASSHGQTTIDDDVCDNVAKYNNMQEVQTMLEYQQQLLQTITSRLGKKLQQTIFLSNNRKLLK